MQLSNDASNTYNVLLLMRDLPMDPSVIEQTLQQMQERIRLKELQLARIKQGASGKENTAPPGQAPIPDILLVCAHPACRRTWKWPPDSQAFYKSMGKGTPKYCQGCRK